MNAPRPLARLTPRLVAAAVAASVLAACSTGDSVAPPTSETPATTHSAPAPPVEVVLDANGRLMLPTATVSSLVLPARVSRELELAGAEAQVVIAPEPEPGGDDDVGRRCTLVVTLETEEVGFGFDSAELSDAGRGAVELVAAEVTGAAVVFVTGHSSAEGDAAYNVDLSIRRANAVADVMRPLLPGTEFVVDGKGAAEPVAPNDTEENRVLNRRVVIAGDVEREECDTAGDAR